MKIKNIFVILLFMFAATSFCQKMSYFAGAASYLNKIEGNAVHFKFNLGVAYKINKILNPEVEINYYLGILDEFEKRNEQNIISSTLLRKYTGHGLAFIPKICFDLSDEAHDGSFQILPRYSITKITATGTLLTINEVDQKRNTLENFSFTEIRHSLGIGIGFICYLSDKKNDQMAINIYYDGIDFANSISNLKYAINKYSSGDRLGFGINFYFSFLKKIKKIND